MTTEQPASSVIHRGRAPRRPTPTCPNRRCGGTLIRRRDGDYVTITCMSCGRPVHDQYRPTKLAYEIRLPPQAFVAPPARTSKPRPKPTLDVPEPELTKLVERYCDLRRRGFSQTAIRTKTRWPRHYPSLLLEEARKREMPDALASQAHAFETWVLTAHDAGAELDAIQRMSGYIPHQTKRKLAAALDDASRRNPDALIVPGPDGNPVRVSWTTSNGHLAHRAFDGPFPRGYPTRDAIDQCRDVLIRLIATGNEHARDRAYTMLLVAEAGLHAFDHRTGREIRKVLHNAGLDDDAKRTVLLHLHEHPSVGKLILDRCGVRSRWLTGKRARFLSRRLREHGFPPAVIRMVVEHAGHNPDAYYMIGAEYRIPEPSPKDLEKCADMLRRAGANDQRIAAALGTLGVPSGGHWPPRRKPQA